MALFNRKSKPEDLEAELEALKILNTTKEISDDSKMIDTSGLTGDLLIKSKEFNKEVYAAKHPENPTIPSPSITFTSSQPPVNKNTILCPHCRSSNVQFMQQNKKGFSFGKAVGGAVLTGGIGTLAGFAGKKGKNQWFCQNCNRTFETN